MISVTDFLTLLFPNKNAHTVFSNELKDVFAIYPVAKYPTNVQRFCINELDPLIDHDPDPRKHYHAKDKPRRANANVTVFRNMLIEVDTELSPVEQIEWVIQNRLPFSTAVSSGGKSVHFIVSLAEPLPDYEAYKSLVADLHSAVAAAGLALDTSVKPPCQLSRMPGVQRVDDGVIKGFQELLHVGSHVELENLKSWITYYLPKKRRKKLKYVDQVEGERRMSNTTRLLIEEHRYITNSRHEALLNSAVQLSKSGFTADEVETMLVPVAEALIPERPSEIYSIIQWASRKN